MSLLEFEFMQRALVASAVVGLAAPAIGIFLVQRRLSLMGDGIGHVAFMGVAAGFFLGVSPVATALVAASGGAVAIEVLRDRGRTAGDLALALIFYGGIAGGALLTYRAGAANEALGYLFGSVLTVTVAEVVVVVAVALGVLGSVALSRRALFAVAYDEDVARVAGLPVPRLNLFIALLAALTISVTMRVVGLLLVSAMLVLPVAAAQQVARSFRTTLLVSCALGMVLSIGGLVVAFYADLAPGATIVAAAIATFALASAVARLPVLGRSVR